MNQIKNIAQDLLKQMRDLWKYVLLYYYFPALLVLLGVLAIVVLNPSVTPDRLFRDITALAELPFYTGAVSQLGSLLWAASATSCFLSLFFMKRMEVGSPQSRRFLLHAGLFSAFLLFDDMFLFHEEIADVYLSMGQKKIYLLYFLIILSFLYFNRLEILSSKYLLLFLAMAALGFSIFLDVVADTFFEMIEGPFYETYEVFFEDGIKFIGIVTWLAFYLRYINDVFAPVFERFALERRSG